MTIAERLARAVDLLAPARDIIAGRVVGAAAPAWSTARGWTSFLLDLDDETVTRCERDGAADGLAKQPGAPADLVELAARASEACRLESFTTPAGSSVGARAREASVLGASPRKRAQLAALLEALEPRAGGARRIVDFGSGHGQLTGLASGALGVPSLGLERDPKRVDRAARIGGKLGEARFVAVDAMVNDVALAPDDIALGLHACGALGDRLVEMAGRAGADVALVGCCPQKIAAAERTPISKNADLTLPKEALGLANLSAGERGVERTLAVMLGARAARHALALLLSRRGLVVAPGEEMRGLNRRRALAPFPDLARAALAIRDLSPPSEFEIESSLRDGRAEHAAMRRLSLPRSALARAIEVFIALDRAAYLVERGYEAEVIELFPRETTPRNVAIFASTARS